MHERAGVPALVLLLTVAAPGCSTVGAAIPVEVAIVKALIDAEDCAAMERNTVCLAMEMPNRSNPPHALIDAFANDKRDVRPAGECVITENPPGYIDRARDTEGRAAVFVELGPLHWVSKNYVIVDVLCRGEGINANMVLVAQRFGERWLASIQARATT